jgi:phosphatidate phosphatase APP1
MTMTSDGSSDHATAAAAGRAAERLVRHPASRIEDAVRGVIERRVRARGWHVTMTGYAGYGSPEWARVFGRVLLARGEPGLVRRSDKVRGWRNFVTVPVSDAEVEIEAGGEVHTTRTNRSGYVDTVVPGRFTPGWETIRLSTPGAAGVRAQVRVVDPAATIGIVSDVDDTVMVTALPRPLLAAWNAFVLDEHSRMAVPGMAVMFERVVAEHSGAPVFYLSTGAWNVAPALSRFLSRHLYPPGPLLLTDWGPTDTGWFRSGRLHKAVTLARLAEEFPHLRWVLVGDDGQHDQEIYAEFAASHSDRVAAVAIRRLSPTQAVLAGNIPVTGVDVRPNVALDTPWLSAPDGAGLWQLLHRAGLA